ncbi:MAG: hypothetical protein HZB55_22105 [Deltaproteobacteria bacterium]|nr:hypothetical protein [Deltaproteobacteria bacterium]
MRRRLASGLRRNFAVRIYLFLAGSLAAFAVLLTAISVHVQGRLLSDQIQREGLNLAVLLADAVRVGVFAENPELLAGPVENVLRRRDVRQVWVFGARRRLLKHANRPGPGGRYTFWAPVLSSGSYTTDMSLYFDEATRSPTALGRVAVELSDAPLREGRHAILTRSILAAGSFLALAALATALVVREATRPLRNLLADIGGHGLSARTAEAGDLGLVRDTFGHLVHEISALTAGLESTVAERTAELQRANAELAHARDELEERVRARTRELEETHNQLLHAEKLSAVGRLAASIAHEFNNPIFGIRSVLQAIRSLETLPRDEAESVDLAIAECNRVAALIRNLQSFNRPSRGVFGLVDVHRALDAILLLCRRELSAKNARVEADYADRLPAVWAVEDQLKQVFLNLLTNAMDALPAQGGAIRLSTRASGDAVSVQFRDAGSGILPEHLPHVFEPFFTTKPEVKGTGLGLPLSYGIVRSHGGTIDVESRPGEGTTFTVRLPIEGARS